MKQMNLFGSQSGNLAKTLSPLVIGVVAAVITLVSVFAQARLYQQKLAEAEMQKAEAQKAQAGAEQEKANAQAAAAQAEMEKATAQKMAAEATVEAARLTNVDKIAATNKVDNPIINEPLNEMQNLNNTIVVLRSELQSGKRNGTDDELTSGEKSQKEKELRLAERKLALRQEASAEMIRSAAAAMFSGIRKSFETIKEQQAAQKRALTDAQ